MAGGAQNANGLPHSLRFLQRVRVLTLPRWPPLLQPRIPNSAPLPFTAPNSSSTPIFDRSTLSGYVGPQNPDLEITGGDLSAGDTTTTNPDGTVTHTVEEGNTAPDIQTMTTTDSNGQVSADTVLTGTTITIDSRVTKNEVANVLLHEGEHGGEARKDPAKFLTDAKAEKNLPHDQRPQEQRANSFAGQHKEAIKQAVKEIQKQRKEEEKKRKKEEKKKKKVKDNP